MLIDVSLRTFQIVLTLVFKQFADYAKLASQMSMETFLYKSGRNFVYTIHKVFSYIVQRLALTIDQTFMY